jgi:hypothetical protein
MLTAVLERGGPLIRFNEAFLSLLDMDGLCLLSQIRKMNPEIQIMREFL